MARTKLVTPKMATGGKTPAQHLLEKKRERAKAALEMETQQQAPKKPTARKRAGRSCTRASMVDASPVDKGTSPVEAVSSPTQMEHDEVRFELVIFCRFLTTITSGARIATRAGLRLIARSVPGAFAPTVSLFHKGVNH
jgi:hypothetical protein